MKDALRDISYYLTINDLDNEPIYPIIVEKDDSEEELKELSIVVSWLIRNVVRFELTYEDNTIDYCKGTDCTGNKVRK